MSDASRIQSFDLAEGQLTEWFSFKGWTPFAFQRETWKAESSGLDGLLLAPTGSGKTLALFGSLLIRALSQSTRRSESYPSSSALPLTLIWVTPLRALAKDLEANLREYVTELNLPITVERRTGDISTSQRQKQIKRMPTVLITTPESLHILFASKGHESHFNHLATIVVDEWHELLGTKRGTQTELALSRLRRIRPQATLWGISATIGNVEEAKLALFGTLARADAAINIAGEGSVRTEVKTVLPDQMDEFPWSGHLGLHLLDKVLPLLDPPGSVLIFTNTRAQSENWFRAILEAKPDLAGEIALHHGSLTQNVRLWVEEALRDGLLRVVVCTSSLDLGVDFSPVDRVIQIGSPKGVARFLQRAGRSGHSPGQISRIHFVPTHALELLEASALRDSIQIGDLESRHPLLKPYDVLIQYLMTLAVSDGFRPDDLLPELRSTWAYHDLRQEEWQNILTFLLTGGPSLEAYPDYARVEQDEEGWIRVTDRRIAQRHRLSIGTIASDTMLRVKFISGRYLGSVEEWFISRLEPGDAFWFAGRNLELVRIHQMTVLVRKAKGAPGMIPSWLGGRMSLSSNISNALRHKMMQASKWFGGAVGGTEAGARAEEARTAEAGADEARTVAVPVDLELEALRPILEIQRRWSILPGEQDFLVERSSSREGHHLFFYPFEGRNVHEGLAALVATRLSRLSPITFTMAMNDYGFELLSDQPVAIDERILRDVFSPQGLVYDMMESLNMAEMAKRRFRDISRISGLVFQGYPGRQVKDRHLQGSASLFYDVFQQYEPDHLLLQQAMDEVLEQQLEEGRIRLVLDRIARQTIHLIDTPRFSPFAFPIFVDRLREKVSSETLADRIRRHQEQVQSEFHNTSNLAAPVTQKHNGSSVKGKSGRKDVSGGEIQ